MDIFSSCLAFGPLAIYLVVVGTLNLSRRPRIVRGTREITALAIALAGFVVVGPMQLFMPREATARFGWAVWLLLGLFYGLCVTLGLIISRPRLVIYNISLEELRSALVEVTQRLDHDTTWAGRAAAMPQMRVHLRLETFVPLRNTSLVAIGANQSANGWQRIERALADALSRVPATPQPRGWWLVLAGLTILMYLAFSVSDNPQEIARGFHHMLQP
jgi:hypothetical protein